MDPNFAIERVFLLGIFIASLFLFLGNLGNQYLWDDEAETALVSKTILTHGIPLAYDGKNYFSQQMGSDYTKNYVWRWHPWLQFYVCAAFFGLFGVSTFVARLPFALFGIGTVFMTYVFCKVLWKNRKLATVSVLLLLICVPFIILSRQCRYYSMVSFFSLAGLYAYVCMLDNKKYSSVFFVLSSILLFHTLYIYCVTLLATVVLYASLFHRNRLRELLTAAACVILVTIPWIIWLSSMQYSQRYGTEWLNFQRVAAFTGYYLHMISRYIFSPYLLLVIPAITIVRRMRTGSLFSVDKRFWKELSLLLFFIIFNLLAVAIAGPSARPFFRYLTPLIPVLIIIAAVLAVAASEIHKTLPVGIIALLILTGSLKNYLYENTHDYDGPIEGIVNYLNTNGRSNDVVAITYGDMPLKFYTKMRIIGGFTGEDLSTATQANWVILRNYAIGNENDKIRQFFLKNVQWENYEKIIINYPDIPFENREDPVEHHFRTVTDEDKVVIFHKIR